jgi:hypothetical protein
MNILILVIYSKTEHYDKMLEVQRKYIHNYKNVEVYFVESCFQHNDPVFIENDMASVRINEDNTTILFKTIATMECLNRVHRRHYDFVIRTNISTIIDIPKMVCLLEKYKNIDFLYAGDLAGIYIQDNHYWFALGTCIILSQKLAIKMIDEKEKFVHSLPDDVAFGVFTTNYCPKAYDNNLKMSSFVYYISDLPSKMNATLEEFIDFANKNNNIFDFICYRNKTNNRFEDAKIMDYIYRHVIKK